MDLWERLSQWCHIQLHRSDLGAAGVMASELPCQWPSAPSLQLPHTHNKHTLSPVRPNHTAQREHINYRYTLNYFHYLPCSVDGTETGMMDGKGFALLPQVANAPSFTFSHPFLACSFFILHQLSCDLHFPICLLHLSPNFFCDNQTMGMSVLCHIEERKMCRRAKLPPSDRCLDQLNELMNNCGTFRTQQVRLIFFILNMNHRKENPGLSSLCYNTVLCS